MNKIKELFRKIDELQKIIDAETADADAGCDWSRSLIINAEIEKEQIQDRIDSLALWIALAQA